MTGWLALIISLFKGTHIAALAVWCGSLIAVPLMLGRHAPGDAQQDYDRMRHATHLTYTICATPAAVIAVVAGTWLIYLREAFHPWLFLKLAVVALLVAAHAWIGHILVQVAEKPGHHRPPPPALPIALVLIPALAILALVLGKPDLAWLTFPEWLNEPRGNQLLFEVPRR